VKRKLIGYFGRKKHSKQVPVLEHGSAASSLSSIPGLQLVNVLPVALAHQFGVAAGQGLVYQRPGQTVGRAVVVLEKV
jgi:hypothetical protein